MNISFKYTLLAAGFALVLSGCDENEWNDKLDGFEVPPSYSKVETVNYTLTAADYATIASNSTNKSLAQAAGEEAVAALAAIGTNCAFASEADARLYLPALLANSSFPYFSMNNGSSVKVTYNLSTNQPAEVKAINAGVLSYTVSEADYQNAWGSDDDFIGAFAPAVTAASKLPSILRGAYTDATSGQYAVVSYKEASTNPIFGNVGENPEPEWEMSDVIATVAKNDVVEIKGLVTAIDSRGFILSDASGSILCYQASGFDVNSVQLGSQITLNGTVSSFNKGFQIAITSDSYTVEGKDETFTYPTPKTVTGADMDAAITRTEDAVAEYVTFTATASVSGNYYNFIVDGATTSQGSGYMVPDNIRALISNGETYTICGYFSSISSGKYYNVVISSVNGETGFAAPKSAPVHRAPAADVPAESKAAIYYFNGSSWSLPESAMVVLQPADYTAMGQSYGNLSGTLPQELLPVYLAQKFPYAADDAAEIVVYKYYDGTTTDFRATEFFKANGEWAQNTGATTDQFTKQNGNWAYNPSVVVTLPYARNTDPSYTYYMACVNWVFDNVTKKLYPDATPANGERPGPPFIDYRNNAEYYSGASAYYGNVDVRATTAKNNAPEGYDGYDGMSDDEIMLLIKKRFSTESMPGALGILYPDAAPVEGMEVTYTINFTAYDGAAVETTIVYVVSGPGQFKYKSSTWVEDGQDADW